jgi:hypothetical protein
VGIRWARRGVCLLVVAQAVSAMAAHAAVRAHAGVALPRPGHTRRRLRRNPAHGTHGVQTLADRAVRTPDRLPPADARPAPPHGSRSGKRRAAMGVVAAGHGRAGPAAAARGVGTERDLRDLRQPRRRLHEPDRRRQLLRHAAEERVRQLPRPAPRRLSASDDGCLPQPSAQRPVGSRSGRYPDENYAREIMQLFSIGSSS